ncbi:MAG: hypothetical protein QM572_15665 [Nocardioides sp.]|uniref:hypothetical protein n=1 Tax=Nocardioides sp. TaxID=35761 RepID=UPI0039E311F6
MTVALRPLDDLLVDGDRCAVMIDAHVVVLSELATTIVLALRESPASVDTLSEVLVTAYGDPGDALTLTRTAVDDLAAHGIVEVAE